MSDAMRYSSAHPDPISVAAYIARYYRVKDGVKGQDLVPLFNDSVRIGNSVLKGKDGLSLQQAMDVVEIARRGNCHAKFIPMGRGNHQSILTRTPVQHESVAARELSSDEKWPIGTRAIFEDVELDYGPPGTLKNIRATGTVVEDIDSRCPDSMFAFRRDSFIVDGAYYCVLPSKIK